MSDLKTELRQKVKDNLMVTHSEDDGLIDSYLTAAISYAEQFQHLEDNYYSINPMSSVTMQGVIMLSSHFYESRDGSTGGYFGDNIKAAEQVWNTVHLLLRMGKEWQV